jgi:hypothetical protein
VRVKWWITTCSRWRETRGGEDEREREKREKEREEEGISVVGEKVQFLIVVSPSEEMKEEQSFEFNSTGKTKNIFSNDTESETETKQD